MSDFEYKASRFALERSLLQKAVRRADIVVTEKTIQYLMSMGDTAWLRDRLFVIAYEECWPMANQLQINDLVSEYKKITSTVKNKNAWGLSKLAVKFNQGSYKLDPTVPDDVNAGIIFISKVLKNPDGFWVELGGFVGYDAQEFRVHAAKKALSRAKFPDDKAIIYAAAYLAVAETVPEVQATQPIHNPNFPYWIAFDKHTADGKLILRMVADKLSLTIHDVMRLTFYKAGVICNQVNNSPYFDMLLKWRDKQMETVLPRWNEVEQEIIRLTKGEAEQLKERISNPPQKEDGGQMSMF